MQENISLDPFTPAIHLIYAPASLNLPTDPNLIANLVISGAVDDPAQVGISRSFDSPSRLLGEIKFGRHRIRIAGLANPLPPDVLDRTVNVSPWQPQIKAAMRQHRSHLSLVYAGDHPDPVEKMIALYQIAFALENENLLGIVNEPAWTAHPPADFLNPKQISTYRNELPFILWMGYVKFYLDPSQYWLVTKGHHIFDVPDLAGMVMDPANEEETINRFINIFYYLYENDVDVTAGDTLELKGTPGQLQFAEMAEELAWLIGPSGMLAVTPLDAPDNNEA
jgi:hypothetical protein